MNKTVMGDRIPSTRAWMSLMNSTVRSVDLANNEEFADLVAWETSDWNGEFAIEAVYRSGREEVYVFSSDCVAGGMCLGPLSTNQEGS